MGVIFPTLLGNLVATSLVLLILAWHYIRRVHGHWERKGLKFLPPTAPFGNFKNLVLQRQSLADQTAELYHSCDVPVLGIWMALRPAILVRDPTVVRQILIKDFNTFHDRGFYCNEERDPLSGTLLSIGGDKWRRLRAKLSPSFSSSKLGTMFSTIVDCGVPLDAFVHRVASNAEPIDVRDLMAQFSINVIASVAFGVEIDCIGNPDDSFRQFGQKVFEQSIPNALRSAVSFLYPKMWTVLGLKVSDRDVEDFMFKMVKETMESRERGDVTRKDFFQLLVQIRNAGDLRRNSVFSASVNQAVKTLSIKECAAQVFVFFLAGFETTSSTIAFALYELARNPECMLRVQEDIDAALDRHGGQITYESVAEMKYLDWCIDETLRMYPTVPILVREAASAWTIPGTSTTIDKGTAVIVPIYALQNDPYYWPQPEQFIPERFDAEQMASRSIADRPYMPFGGGPRQCIGMRLAKLQTKVGLIVMLHKYSYELAGSTTLPLEMQAVGFLLNPVGGINLKITHR